MGDLHGARVAVIGGGVLGLSAALSVAQSGASVILYEAQRLGDNASGVAAGMLAPAFEAVLDPLSSGHFHLLSAARDLWPGFIEAVGLPDDALSRSGAVWVGRPGEDDRLVAVTARLKAEGAETAGLNASELRSLQPGLAPDVIGGVLAPQDWQLDPQQILPAMHAALNRLGGTVVQARVGCVGEAVSVDGARLEADHLILAMGADVGGWVELAPELAAITPVKGQILHLAAAPTSGPVVRGGFGYVAPQGRGAVVGATMQPGLADCSLDPEVLDALKAGAADLFPHLASVSGQGRAGVRGTTPDGLPLVGLSSRPGVSLALGARRNGWLLGPLVGRIILASLLGEGAGPYAAALDPTRQLQPRQPPRS